MNDQNGGSPQQQGPNGGYLNSPLPDTAEGAEREIRAWKADAEFSKRLMDRHDFQRVELSGRWDALHKIAYGAPSQPDGDGQQQPAEKKPEPSANNDPHLMPPESPNGYRMAALPPGMERDEELEGEFREWAFDLGVAQQDVEFVSMLYNDTIAQGVPSAEEMEAMYRQTMRELAARHGGEEKAKQIAAAANSVLDALPPAKKERVVQLLEVSGLRNNRMLIERLAEISKRRLVRGR